MPKEGGHLPIHEAKHHKSRSQPWLEPHLVSIPGVHNRRLRIYLPHSSVLAPLRLSKLRRKRGPLFLSLACLAAILTFMLVKGILKNSHTGYSAGEPPTLVFHRHHLREIWKWEIASGHYPSRAPIPPEIGFEEIPINPATPNRPLAYKPSRYLNPDAAMGVTDAHGVGPKRVYLDLQSHPPDVAYPPRPVPGSVADMDEIMRHCDFSKNKYVRDCLEVLRIGGGLDNGQRFRRENLDDWKYIYIEQPLNATEKAAIPKPPPPPPVIQPPGAKKLDPDYGLKKHETADWEDQLFLGPTREHRPATTLETPCDPENPRLFHMFWTGPFTDKPYLALLSFLYTQKTGLHLKKWPEDSKECRPQFWLWINPGPAASAHNPTADMFAQLKASPWAAPFLHPRFKDVIQFKRWNTTEQLDSIHEIKHEWRALQEQLFNSGGHIMSIKKPENVTTTFANGTIATIIQEDDMAKRTGSTSSSTYDRLSVILSDMARFVLCHRFGGVYLDADTILLRDWEELFGWKGAFAYRWSRLPNYNTAVLRMNKGSALGSFLFRTALKNGLDFHPMTVSSYTKDAFLEPLLLRLPDALFDAAWLNTEEYQRDRPPQPYFTKFQDFFDTPSDTGASPQALGIKGFFRGSYSYHFHNFWWKPFDPARNFPDLGPRFAATEKLAHEALRKAKMSNAAAASGAAGGRQAYWEHEYDEPAWPVTPGKDKRDLDWSAVIKRTFEAYIRGEAPNMYGEWLDWGEERVGVGSLHDYVVGENRWSMKNV